MVSAVAPQLEGPGFETTQGLSLWNFPLFSVTEFVCPYMSIYCQHSDELATLSIIFSVKINLFRLTCWKLGHL